jgi:3-(3-hydroxy-phenyl)propionate hydroxylase
MGKAYTNPEYLFVRSADQDASAPVHHPIVIVGGGPSGLSAALEFALQGLPSVVLDDNNTVSNGSRAICFAKRTLEIMDRYGCGDRMLSKGVTWQIGKVFFQDALTYEFNLLPEWGHKMPAFINLQQYYFEEYLVDRCADFPEIDLRWLSKAKAIEPGPDGVGLAVETPQGDYRLSCDYLLVADGANSHIRESFGLAAEGQVFHDKFLIADITMRSNQFPSERWFWFDPPFHRNRSVLLHKQPDDVWRIDFQLDNEADAEVESQPERVIPRIQAMLGEDIEFELEWLSVYTFRCRRMKDFIYRKRIFFMGDAAHQVSPFGARGANGAVQSVENLAWKLARVLRGSAPIRLLSTYQTERSHGANENLLISTRTANFMAPKNDMSRLYRDEVLHLARDFPFARTLINSGRLSQPCALLDSPLNTQDTDEFCLGLEPGRVCQDAPVRVGGNAAWLMNYLGTRFTLMVQGGAKEDQLLVELAGVEDLQLLTVNFDHKGALKTTRIDDPDGHLSRHYQLRDGTAYLIRPDQHVCARWRQVDSLRVQAAMDRALGKQLPRQEQPS